MNPMIILFVLAMFIDDYFFKEGKLLKLYFYAIIGYVIFYCFQQRSTFHSPTKKLNMAAYNQSFDPTIYGKVNFDLAHARKFIEKQEKEIGKKITMTLYWVKVVGEVFQNLPECNEIIRFGLKAKRKEVDIGVLGYTHNGEKISNITLRNVPGKTFSELCDEMIKETAASAKDNKMKAFLQLFPSL